MEVVEPTLNHESHAQPEESGPRLFSGRQIRPRERTAGGVI
jgi:hypothetical protein